MLAGADDALCAVLRRWPRPAGREHAVSRPDPDPRDERRRPRRVRRGVGHPRPSRLRRREPGQLVPGRRGGPAGGGQRVRDRPRRRGDRLPGRRPGQLRLRRGAVDGRGVGPLPLDERHPAQTGGGGGAAGQRAVAAVRGPSGLRQGAGGTRPAPPSSRARGRGTAGSTGAGHASHPRTGRDRRVLGEGAAGDVPDGAGLRGVGGTLHSGDGRRCPARAGSGDRAPGGGGGGGGRAGGGGGRAGGGGRMERVGGPASGRGRDRAGRTAPGRARSVGSGRRDSATCRLRGCESHRPRRRCFRRHRARRGCGRGSRACPAVARSWPGRLRGCPRRCTFRRSRRRR